MIIKTAYMKTTASLIVGTLMVATVLTGCGKKTDEQSDDALSGTAVEQAQEDVSGNNTDDTVSENDTSESEEDTVDEPLGEQFGSVYEAHGNYDYTFILDNAEYSLPEKLDSFTDNGWVLDSYSDDIVMEPGEMTSEYIYKDGMQVNLQFLNRDESEEKNMTSCDIVGIDVLYLGDYYLVQEEDDTEDSDEAENTEAEVKQETIPEPMQFEAPNGMGFGDSYKPIEFDLEYSRLTDPKDSEHQFAIYDTIRINSIDTEIGSMIYYFEDSRGLVHVHIDYYGV